MRVCATVWRGMAQRLGMHAQRDRRAIAGSGRDNGSSAWRSRRAAPSSRNCPELPRRGERQPGIEVDHLAQQALCDGVLQRQHHRREAQLEIDGGLELLGAADLEDVASLRRDRRPSASGSARPRHPAVPAARRHDATGGVARSKIASLTAAASSTEPKAFTPHASASFSALALIGIVEAGDRKAGLAVGRKMRVADDRTGAEGDDRAWAWPASARIARARTGQRSCRSPRSPRLREKKRSSQS